MKIRDRIRELRRVKASELMPHPGNWREHPSEQRDAMRGILADVGWADAVLVRETADGLQLIDGHLRAETAPEAEIPVLVLDVDEAEADLILATHDPIAAMAKTNAEALEGLLTEIETQSEALDDMFRSMGEQAGFAPPDFEPVSEDDQGKLDEKELTTCPECGHQFER